MKLTISKSKNNTFFYMSESFRNEKGISTTRTVEALGSEKEIKEKYGVDDARAWAKAYVEKFNKEAKKEKPVHVDLMVKLNTSYENNTKRSFNVGYLPIQKELYSLGFKELCEKISKDYKFEYDLEQILAHIIYARILEPCSKKASYEFCKENLLEEVNYEQHDVYRALDVIQQNSELIQSHLYDVSTSQIERNTNILYYDCTNFYFEITEETDLLKYGKSKENRPNPIIELGMFMDGSGIPLGFDTFPRSCNEQLTLKPLEQRILKDFELNGKRLIVCTDAGLASDKNRRFNSTLHRDFIVIQSLKKMDKVLLDWCLNPGRSLRLNPIAPDENPHMVKAEIERDGWRVDGSNELFSLDDINEEEEKHYHKIFYKEKWLVGEKGHVEQRLIVTYSIKYKHFLKHKRENHLKRAQKIIDKHDIKKIDAKTKCDEVKRYIKATHTTNSGEIATDTVLEIDNDVVKEQERYDGFYAVCTSIDNKEMSVRDIINVNKNRWEIEESFMLMKTEFKSRPVYLQRDERIKAHFTTCFIALLVFRILEKKVNDVSQEKITAQGLIDALREMRISKIDKYYSGNFIGTTTTDSIQENANMKFNCELMTQSHIDSCIKKSKKIQKNLKIK